MTLEEFCGEVPLDTFDYSINISLKYNYLYTETPKVACSSIKSILQKMEMEDPDFIWKDSEEIHNRSSSPLLKPTQINHFEQFLNGPIFTFCFSRNPFTRILSAYLEKICDNKHQKTQVLLHLGRDTENREQSISFGEFIGVICEQSISEMDPHWRNQYQQTFQETLKYDFIGKLEAFPSDLHYALNRINSEYPPYYSEEKRHSKKSGLQLNKFYTPHLIKKVQDKFIQDFEFFGYDLDVRNANKPMEPTTIKL